MEYQVPQFIEVEDKIVGPLTLKQFIYLAGTAGLCTIFFFTLPLIFAILASIPIIALGVALAFYKMNGKSFVQVLEAGFAYYTKGKLFLWKKAGMDAAKQAAMETAAAKAAQEATAARLARTSPRLTRGKLTELAWSLDVSGGSGRSGADGSAPSA